MSTEPAPLVVPSKPQSNWQLIALIVVAALLVIVVGLLAWLFVNSSAQASELKHAEARVSSLKHELATTKSASEAAQGQYASAKSQLTHMTGEAIACGTAASLYSHALGQIAQAVLAGLDSSTATVYLLQAREDQSAANTLNCQLTQG